MNGRFRHTPPDPQPWWIARPRVRQRLERRFAVPVTVIAAPAGYGKTSALALTRAARGAGSDAVDVWVQCDAADAEPVGFAQAVITAVDVGAAALDQVGAIGRPASRTTPICCWPAVHDRR